MFIGRDCSGLDPVVERGSTNAEQSGKLPGPHAFAERVQFLDQRHWAKNKFLPEFPCRPPWPFDISRAFPLAATPLPLRQDGAAVGNPVGLFRSLGLRLKAFMLRG